MSEKFIYYSKLSWRSDSITIVFLSVLFLFNIFQFSFHSLPAEDAAMLLRYSQNLSNGQGIVWNKGEKPVDGATDFLFMAILALIAKMGITIESTARILGIFSHLLTIWIVYLGCRRLFKISPAIASFPVVFLVFGPGLRYSEMLFGTSFFTLMVTMSGYLALKLLLGLGTRSTALSFAGCSLLMGLSRPEGVLVGGLFLISIIFNVGWKPGKIVFFYFIFIFALFGGAYFIWRWFYFGYPLPNPFYKKGAGMLYPGSLIDSISNIIQLGFPFILIYFYVLVSLIYSFFTVGSLKKLAQILNRIGIFLLSIWLLIFILSGPYLIGKVYFAGYLRTKDMLYFIVMLLLIIGGFTLLRNKIAIAELLMKVRRFFHLPEYPDSEPDLIRITFAVSIPIGGYTLMWILLSNEMNGLMRFQYPILPFLLICTPIFLRWLPGLSFDKSSLIPDAKKIIAFFVLAITLLFVQLGRFGQSSVIVDGRYALAQKLKPYVNKGYVMATTEAGLLPYYSQWRAIDTWGLNDQWIAHQEGIISIFYLEKYRPQIIMFHDTLSKSIENDIQSEGKWGKMISVLKEYVSSEKYILAARYGVTPYDTHCYYVRTDFPDSQSIISLIRKTPYYLNGDICFNYLN